MIISFRDNENKKSKRKWKKQRQKNIRGDPGYSESMIAKWFSCAFKLDFIQIMCKIPLIFKSNLELSLSIILKEKELYESKHAVAGCKCLKIWDLQSFLICSSNLILNDDKFCQRS